MSQAAITVRPAAEADAPSLVEFNRAMARETEDKQLPLEIVSAGVRALLRDPRLGFYLVAEAPAGVVGCLAVTFEWSDWRNGMFWWIQSVYVRPEYRRRGVYKMLYEFVKRRAGAEGNVCGFRLYVEKENDPARKAYEALGMKEAPYRIFEEIER